MLDIVFEYNSEQYYDISLCLYAGSGLYWLALLNYTRWNKLSVHLGPTGHKYKYTKIIIVITYR